MNQIKTNQSQMNQIETIKSQMNQIKTLKVKSIKSSKFDQIFHFISAPTKRINKQYSSEVRSTDESSCFKTAMFSFKSRHF